ncbi:ERVV2 protein, partial [Picathartes gymnocephalus]|nr:ERVV2 protein [Picathartes gymnocephalus]
TAQMGGVCTLINTSCCTYIDQSGQITDIQTIWQHAKILHDVTKADTSWSTHIWETLISWLPNLNWLKQLFTGILLLGIIILCTCIFSQCFLWCCQRTTMSYDDWKRYKLRQSRKRNVFLENK